MFLVCKYNLPHMFRIILTLVRRRTEMLRITRTVVPHTLLFLACSAGLLQAAETRTPTPEEFRELVRKYNESGGAGLNPRNRPPVPQQSLAADQYNQAVTLHTKKDVSARELKEAAALYQAASDGGIAEASVNLALLYLEGKGVRKDSKKALSLLNSASQKGVSQADVMLARLYLTGKDVKMDEKKAEALLNKAIKAGNQNAVKMLAEFKEWKKKNEKAMKEFQEMLKKAQASPGASKQLNLTPPSPANFPMLPVIEPPFPVIPGRSYLAVNNYFPNIVPPPQSQPVTVTPKIEASTPQPVKVPSAEKPTGEQGVAKTPSDPGLQKPDSQHTVK
jgi:hypothetical protein